VSSFAAEGEAVSETVAAAMTFLANTDALVIDLRRNGGGRPQTVALLSSYLFDAPVLLNSLYWREWDRTDDFWTSATVKGRRYGKDKPVFVLTSARTFSAAEEFAYNLKNLERATIVGETTGGGANPGGMRRLSEDFTMFVPMGRAINPVTKTNWEGTGVAPDVAVASENALQAALELARKAASSSPQPH
jgi:C-terminal processing protease CtpA/Prc